MAVKGEVRGAAVPATAEDPISGRRGELISNSHRPAVLFHFFLENMIKVFCSKIFVKTVGVFLIFLL